MENIIEVSDLKYKYPHQEDYAINNINLSVRKGEFVCILGKNGSGKSTLAKLLNAQIKPSQGDIIINGYNTKDDKNLWEIRKSCGMVFQNPDNQMVATIVEEDVAFGPENLAIEHPELRKRVDKALKRVGMYEYRKRPPYSLSGGQKQRVAIAGVLAMDAECIVFDEPTAMLDPQGRKDIMDTIKMLKEDGNTILYITHFMDEAIRADRILVFDEGEIKLSGSPREVFSQVDKMKELGLDIPQVTQLQYLLEKDGYDYGEIALNVNELLEKL